MTKFSAKTWVGALRISSVFGSIDSVHSTPHGGVDIITSGACLAPFAGTVTRGLNSGSSGGLGNYFQMVSDNGRFMFTVGHGNTNSDVGLRRGDRVAAGDRVMASYGIPTTGRSTGPHYHEELTDRGRRVNLLDYLGKTWGVSTKPTVEVTSWDGVSTLYKGKYADDGMVYTIHVGETIWGVARDKGVTLAQVRAWTAALAGSKYAGKQLAKSGPGSSWWNGSNKYYAGCTFAVADVVGKFVAEDQKVAQAKQETAEQAAEAATQATEAAELAAQITKDEKATKTAKEDKAAEVEVEVEAIAPVLIEAKITAQDAAQESAELAAELADAIERAQAQIPIIETNVAQALSGHESSDNSRALAGLLAEHPTTRKRVYYTYASLALIVSIGPDVVVAGVLSTGAVPGFVATVALASSILLKVGTAFGFVAASNTAKGK